MPDTLDSTTYTYGGLSYVDETDGGIYGNDWGLGPSTSYATRAQIVNSAQGQALLSDISWNELLRPLTSAETTSAENSIVQGASFEDVIYQYSHSAEASSDITNIYNQLLIHAPTGAELQSGVATLQANGSLTEIRHSVAYSTEAQSDLNASYEAVLNRAGDAGGVAAYQSLMAGGQSQQNVRADLANSTEALNDLQQVIQNVQGRTANANDTPWIQGQINSLGNGTTTMSSVIYNLASGSGETPILQQVIQNVQGRVANANDTPWINGQIQRLENGTASIAQITYELASGSGETPILQQVIQNVQGRPATANDTPWINGQIQSLEAGISSIAQIQAGLANSSGETTQIDALIISDEARQLVSSDSAFVSSQESALGAGTETYNQVMSTVAYSAGTSAGISAAYNSLTVDGVLPSQLSGCEAQLAAGTSTAAICAQLANPTEYDSDIIATYETVLGSDPTVANVAAGEQTMTSGLSSSTTWYTLGSTLANDALQFLSAVDPVGTAQAAMLTSQQQQAQIATLKADLQNPAVSNFLEMIRHAENTTGFSTSGLQSQGYYNTNSYITSTRTLPDLNSFHVLNVHHTSAGAYQIVSSEYQRFAKILGVTDFSPQTQDLLAAEILSYSPHGQASALSYLMAGNTSANFNAALAIAARTWFSLPVGPASLGLDHIYVPPGMSLAQLGTQTTQHYSTVLSWFNNP